MDLYGDANVCPCRRFLHIFCPYWEQTLAAGTSGKTGSGAAKAVTKWEAKSSLAKGWDGGGWEDRFSCGSVKI